MQDKAKSLRTNRQAATCCGYRKRPANSARYEAVLDRGRSHAESQIEKENMHKKATSCVAKLRIESVHLTRLRLAPSIQEGASARTDRPHRAPVIGRFQSHQPNALQTGGARRRLPDVESTTNRDAKYLLRRGQPPNRGEPRLTEVLSRELPHEPPGSTVLSQ